MQNFSHDVYTAGAHPMRKLPSCNPHKRILKNTDYFRYEDVKCFMCFTFQPTSANEIS